MSDLIDSREAGRILKRTPRWVTDLINRGDIPAQRVGNQWVIDRQIVVDYAARQAADKAAKKK